MSITQLPVGLTNIGAGLLAYEIPFCNIFPCSVIQSAIDKIAFPEEPSDDHSMANAELIIYSGGTAQDSNLLPS